MGKEHKAVYGRRKEGDDMKYIIVDRTNGDEFNEEFDNKEEAIEKAKADWEHLSGYDKKRRLEFYVLESVNPDEEAENHFDGDIVWRAK